MDLQGLVARLAMEREAVRRALGHSAELRPAGWSGPAASAFARQLEVAHEAGAAALGGLDAALHAAQRALTCSLAAVPVVSTGAAPGTVSGAGAGVGAGGSSGAGSGSRWG